MVPLAQLLMRRGNVKLENVTVLGRIICSGTGASEGGEASILLRNVTADEMLIDNLQDNKVSIKADGITQIGRTTVRTSAYIEDNTPEGMGLQYISIEGDFYPEGEEPEGWEPIEVDLAGRIGEVVNRTPGSQVRAAKGTIAKLTVDGNGADRPIDGTALIGHERAQQAGGRNILRFRIACQDQGLHGGSSRPLTAASPWPAAASKPPRATRSLPRPFPA